MNVLFMHSDPYFCPMESTLEAVSAQDMLSFEAFRNSVIADYKLAIMSREVSLLGRREVLTGKAKFGIFGDGKEVAQIALSKLFIYIKISIFSKTCSSQFGITFIISLIPAPFMFSFMIIIFKGTMCTFFSKTCM